MTAGNGYGALVRLGRSRGWVTVEEINDHLPESAVRTAEKRAGDHGGARPPFDQGVRDASRRRRPSHHRQRRRRGRGHRRG
ncbi:MAG: RNA polymerase sigma factor region1.1 domain-containing protein [Sutterella wadsworthensis]